jgi:hypothetical protein
MLKKQRKATTSLATLVDPMDFSDPRLRDLANTCSSLTSTERKSLIVLARSQSIPARAESPVLFEKVAPILDKLSLEPPFINLHTTPLSIAGNSILHMVQSPLLTGLVIVFALGMPYTETDIQKGWRSSFDKELLATQTRRLDGEWYWDAIVGLADYRGCVIHSMFPSLSPLQYRFHQSFSNFRLKLRDRIVLPHYSNRGISKETGAYILNRIDKTRRYGIYGNKRTFHQSIDPSNVTSKDVIHHYIRTGTWPRGRTEMRQAWTPNILQPRTYFSWGGDAIACSSYLRNIFNDLADCFQPTQRKNRVQPDWLYDPDVPPGGFFFYDLTSFTSWFHEQVPFLKSVARGLSGTYIYLVGEDLTLTYHDVGSLIDGYVKYCNDFPPFVLSEKLGSYGPDSEFLSLYHLCAGFLGVPGNLATCTLAHGLAMASRFDHPRQLQVPGDDVGGSFSGMWDKVDKTRCATTLGKLQMDKVYSLPETAVYLKRLVVDHGSSIELADMLIFPLLPYLVDNTQDRKAEPHPYTLPQPDLIVKRACGVMVSFMRDLFRLSNGDLNQSERSLILSFLQGIHDRLKIPYGAVWQSRFYCDEGSPKDPILKGVTLKFPVVDEDDILHDPDLRFADRYVEIMHIRGVRGIAVDEILDDLVEGMSIVVPEHKGWTFLEDMGYVKLMGIPGDVITLVGPDAKMAFLNAHKPNLRRVVVTCDLSLAQLCSVGVIKEPEVSFFHSRGAVVGEVSYDQRAEQSWRYSRYVDFDNPFPLRQKGPVSVKSGDFGIFDPDDMEEWSDSNELDY